MQQCIVLFTDPTLTDWWPEHAATLIVYAEVEVGDNDEKVVPVAWLSC